MYVCTMYARVSYTKRSVSIQVTSPVLLPDLAPRAHALCVEGIVPWLNIMLCYIEIIYL